MNAFEALLANFRRMSEDELSDAEAWRLYQDAQVYPITHCTVSRISKPDVGGALARQAKRHRERHADFWRGYLTRVGAEIPEYLV